MVQICYMYSQLRAVGKCDRVTSPLRLKRPAFTLFHLLMVLHPPGDTLCTPHSLQLQGIAHIGTK